ncbi:MAG: hypothetical protein CGW95_06920 [Phenylobacterium zucineum]|nr:MAG: hypothetical protein CGW95_06920 [Phenylobacterium zucineum]
MSWGKKTFGGVEYDLDHLEPFTLNVTPKGDAAPTFKVLVSFGHHTFTREFNDQDPVEMKFTHNGDERCFCNDRYGHSLFLPGIVTSHAAGRAYFSQKRNYLLVENLPGVVGPYVVFSILNGPKSPT